MKRKCNFLIGVFTFALIVLFPLSCKKDAPINVDMGYEYFPLIVGSWIIYDMDSTVYDDFTNTVKFYKYQVKEVIQSTFTDNEGRTTHRIERYSRSADTAAWQISDVWFANRTQSDAQMVEENIRYIKLIFPVKKGKEWNGNAMNISPSRNYQYFSADEKNFVNNFTFDSTATVLQIENENLFEKKYYLEVYAKNIGLIDKEVTDILDTDTVIDLQKPLTQRVDAGVIYSMKIKSWGK